MWQMLAHSWLISVYQFGVPQQISTGFTYWLRYCSDIAHRRPTSVMFGRLLGCYIIYTFSGALAPWQSFAGCKIHFTSKSCVLVHWQRYCTALQQRASAKLCDILQGMELLNFRRGRHLYLAGRSLHWASAHILVIFCFCVFWNSSTTLIILTWIVRHKFSLVRCVCFSGNTYDMLGFTRQWLAGHPGLN